MDGGPAGRTARQTRPVIAEPAPLPRDDGAGLHEDEDVSPTRPRSGQPGPEKAVGDMGSGSSAAAQVDGELVAQSEHLEMEGHAGTEADRREASRVSRTAFMDGRRLPDLGDGHGAS